MKKVDIAMVPMPRLWIAEGAAETFAVGKVEAMVSQQAEPSLPPPERQSAPTLSPPNPEGYDDGFYLTYALVKIVAGDKEASRPGSDEEPRVAPLKYHLRRWLELTEGRAEPADGHRGTARLRRRSDGHLRGVTGISENA